MRSVVLLVAALLVLLVACGGGREYSGMEEVESGAGGAPFGGAPPLQGVGGAGGGVLGSAGRGGAFALGGANSGGGATIPSAGALSGGGASVGGGGASSTAGAAATLTSATTSVNLNTVEVGTTSATTTWRIENRGVAATGVPTLTNANDAEVMVVSNTCTAAIPAGQACTVGFALRPTAGGNRAGKLTLYASPGGTVSLAIAGAGGYRVTVSIAGGTSTTSVTSTPAGITCGSTCTAILAGSVKFTATTTNGSGIFHTGWGADAANCSTPSRDCIVNMTEARAVTVKFSPLNNNLIFGTSTAVIANKGNAAAYDADCNAAATAAGINNAAGTDYVAVVSDNMSSVRTRLGSNARGWIRRDGLPFADTQTALFTSDVVLNPVRFDEFGNASTRTYTLSGTLATGASNPPACGNWTLNTADSTFMGGSLLGGPQSWISSINYTCSYTGMAVMCMGKSRTAQLTTTPTNGRRIWVTTTAYVLADSTPDQKCQTERPAGVTTAKALVATTSRSAASVLDMQATYVRPDGVVVGTGSQLAAGGELSSGIWQRADLSYARLTGRFWTGQSTLLDPGTAATTCDNWTATTGTGNWTSGAETRNWWGQSNSACTTTNQLRCVEAP